MKTFIKNIANIQTGCYARPIEEGDVVYLQSKHFNEYGQLNALLHPDLNRKEISEKHLLKDGDVLFAAKGTKNFAVVYENHNEPAVASTSFFVIRINNNAILPNYLAWFFNSHHAQTIIKGQALGTSILSISKQVLENLELEVPSIETQKAILQIITLRAKEKKLKQDIEALREKEIQVRIMQAVAQ